MKLRILTKKKLEESGIILKGHKIFTKDPYYIKQINTEKTNLN